MPDRPDNPDIKGLPDQDDPSLTAAIHDGKANAIMLGCGEAYLTPFGIFLQASTLQIGLLATLPQMASAIFQWLNAWAMDRYRSRLTVILPSVLCQALLWIPIGLLPFLFDKGETTVYLLIVLTVLYQATAGFSVPVWSSLIGDLVPTEIRGRFFGQRNRACGLSSFMALSLAGIALHLFEQSGKTAIGFFIIFLTAALARLNSRRWLGRYRDPEFVLPAEQIFTFSQFLRRSPHSNFAQFVYYIAAINLAVSFSAPYFALYMLRDLQFSYLEFTIVTATVTVTQFLMFRYWGELADRFGNKKILNVCGWGITVIPILWLVSADILYLIILQIYSGIVWAGFTLASSNFLFDAVSPPKRARCVAYQALINGVAVLIGSLSGGYVAVNLPHSFAFGLFTWTPAHSLPVIFLLSGIMRLVASAIMLHKFKEVRSVEPIRNRELIYLVSHLRPLAGATFSLLTSFGLSDKPNRRKSPEKPPPGPLPPVN